MRIRLSYSIMLALLVGAVSVVFYRSFCERDAEPLIVSVQAAPPAPVQVVCAPPKPTPPPTPMPPPTLESIMLSGDCARCDTEFERARMNPSSGAHRFALEICVRRRCRALAE